MQKAESCLGRLALLNPRVELVADTQSVDEKSEDFFASFNLVCLTGGTLNQIVSGASFLLLYAFQYVKIPHTLDSLCSGFFPLLVLLEKDQWYLSEARHQVPGG